MKSRAKEDPARTAIKELLLADHLNFSESLWKNEQTGETRVNWFIGIVTGAAGGLIGLTTAEHRPHGEPLRFIFLAALFALLSFGIVTLHRIIKRNETTDGYKKDSDRIRRMFRKHFDAENILENYHPFGQKSGKSSQPRKLGGLAHTVSIINALIIAGIVAAFSFPFGNAATFNTASDRFWLIYLLTPLAFIGAGIGQFNWLKSREAKARNPSHAGGIVFQGSTEKTQYLLVGPKKEPKKELTKGGRVIQEWIFPKGHIEDGEEHWETAVREVREETGIIGQPICVVGSDEFLVGEETIKVKYYLIEKISETQQTSQAEKHRRRNWFNFDKAVNLLTHPINRDLLRQAERKRRANQEN